MTPDDFWPGLEADSLRLSPGELIARRVCVESACDIRLAVQVPGPVRMLLVMLEPKHVPLNMELPSAHGFESQRVTLPKDSPGRVGVAIKLTDRSYLDVFSTLVQDVAEILNRLKDESAAFRTLIGRLKVWQGFMQKSGPQGLDTTKQIGLYGELRFLHDHLIPTMGSEKALAAWTGPDGTPQDFQCGPSAVEVKTTAVDHQLVRISNALQLDDSTVNVLFLLHLAVDRRNAHGQTLAELVDLLRATVAISPEASELLATRLLQVGYLDMHADHYRQSGYTDRAMRNYHVRDGFPRILPSSLPTGLQDIEYAIQVSAMIPFEVPTIRVVESLREL